MYCRLDDICKNWSGITYNRLIIIVIKNQCPFCGKSLRVVPINSEEYCPHCGCKIEQEHKKIQVCNVFAMKGIKIELLGIATILLGIAVTTNNFFGYVLGFLGFGVAVAGCFLKDKH